VTMVYVYGVASVSEPTKPLGADGIEAAPVRLVGEPELGALVSDLDTDALSAPQAVRAHWRVLEEASAVATVIPARFGMVMDRDEDVCERLLDANRESLTALARELTGKVQLQVKGEYDEPRMLAEIVQGAPAVAELRERLRGVPEQAGYYDRIRLGELVSAEVEARRTADTDTVLAALEPIAAATREQLIRHSGTAFDIAFLVRREAMNEFTAAVRALDRELHDRIDLSYVGPSPAYSFAEANLDEGTPAWA
jgi:hypothetical protein